MNLMSQGTQVRLRLAHNDEIFEAVGRVVYVSPDLKMRSNTRAIAFPRQVAMYIVKQLV